MIEIASGSSVDSKAPLPRVTSKVVNFFESALICSKSWAACTLDNGASESDFSGIVALHHFIEGGPAGFDPRLLMNNCIVLRLFAVLESFAELGAQIETEDELSAYCPGFSVGLPTT
jgi:hypothetical protein